MNNLSIRIKYALPAALLTIALLVISAMDNLRYNELEGHMNHFTGVYLPSVNAVLNADRDLHQSRMALDVLVNRATPSTSAQLINDIQSNAEQAKSRFTAFHSEMSIYQDINQQASRFDTLYANWLGSSEKIISLSQQGSNAAALILLDGKNKQDFDALRAMIDSVGELAVHKAVTLEKSVAEQAAYHTKVGWFGLLIVITAAVLVTFFSQRALVNRITEVTARINEIGSDDGDLTAQIVVTSNDEIGDQARAFNRFVKGLADVVYRIDTDVQSLQQKSGELDESALKTSQIAMSQSTSSDTILSAVHEMSMTTKEMADNAGTGAQLTNDAIAQANVGLNALQQAVVQIEELYQTIETTSTDAKALAEASKNIAGVLEVISGIAEQTNLLALNAAIEAARAGEKGRGFAVVADEVRNLAQKTQESTDSIRMMIESIQNSVSQVVTKIDDGFEKVTNSVALSKETEETLLHTSELLNKVNDMSIETASATEQQTMATEDINNHLLQLNDQVQTTKSVSERTHLNAEEVRQLANNIAEGISRFKTA
uniref:methyl-accepting chemotaxis protein n=1 Tax=Thaumasiovibrio occultus TaxID=1891184 RepID=UPI000B35DE1E|nr:methyl-accepting chemotaxis protein [Thaumasiovibrio occultus]